MAKAKRRAFTLVEVLVCTFVLGFILTAVASGLKMLSVGQLERNLGAEVNSTTSKVVEELRSVVKTEQDLEQVIGGRTTPVGSYEIYTTVEAMPVDSNNHGIYGETSLTETNTLPDYLRNEYTKYGTVDAIKDSDRLVKIKVTSKARAAGGHGLSEQLHVADKSIICYVLLE